MTVLENPSLQLRVRRLRRVMRVLQASCLALVVCLAGCDGGDDEDEPLETEYGSREPEHGGEKSVNGAAVFAEIFQAAGHEVVSVARLSPRVEAAADVIVWFPRTFHRPDPRAVDWLESWLWSGQGRTLIFVGRDFDAEMLYWREVRGLASQDDLQDVQRRYADARTRFLAQRELLNLQPSDWFWFQMKGRLRHKKVNELQGDADWLRSVDASKVEIELFGRINRQGFGGEDVLLRSGEDVLVLRRRLGGGQIIAVANGSFLLNLPLINHEHRKLAAALINEVGKDKHVIFLEAGGGGGSVSESDPQPEQLSQFRFFWVFPIGFVTLGFLLLFIMAVFALWPIFGAPRDDKPRRLSDFGRHVEALGDLMKKTRDENYARGRLAYYHEHVRSEVKQPLHKAKQSGSNSFG